MPEPTTRELYEKINSMAIDISVMNTKMDFVMDSKKTAEEAKQTADKALSLAQENRELIRGMKDNTKWLWGCGIALVAAIVPIGIAVFS